jgi:hypothetical protein
MSSLGASSPAPLAHEFTCHEAAEKGLLPMMSLIISTQPSNTPERLEKSTQAALSGNHRRTATLTHGHTRHMAFLLEARGPLHVFISATLPPINPGFKGLRKELL